MSTTSLCRAALTAAAPSASRGGDLRRVPGRRAAAGSAGFRGVAFTLSMAPPPKPKVTMVACTGEPKPTYYGDEDEFDKFYAALSEHAEESLSGRQFIHIPLELSEEEWEVQNKLKEVVERCMELQADAMRRLSPEQRRPLYMMFRAAHLAFVSVKVRAVEGNANWGVSSLLIVHKLNAVRKMVSSACSAPLPLDRDKQVFSLLPLFPPFLLDKKGDIGGLGGFNTKLSPHQGVAFALIEYTYKTVKSDIDEMITAASATTTSS